MSILPISNALREAKHDSLSDLMNQDLETADDATIEKIMIEQRAQVERNKLAEGSGRKTRQPKIAVDIKPTGNVKDLEI